MHVERVRLRDFRCYEDAEVALGDHLTIVHGANASGKTNLLEGLYFACTARSFRTANERELVRFGCVATNSLSASPRANQSGCRSTALRWSACQRHRIVLRSASSRQPGWS